MSLLDLLILLACLLLAKFVGEFSLLAWVLIALVAIILTRLARGERL